MAEAMRGNGDLAYEYLRAYLPAAYNTKADIREIEPYVLSQSTHTKYSPRHGASRIPWLSGSATWTYHAICQYVLGIRPEYKGLRIDPCIPADWKYFEVERQFRGKKLKIKVDNKAGVENGVREILLNGTSVEGNLISIDMIKEENDVLVSLG